MQIEQGFWDIKQVPKYCFVSNQDYIKKIIGDGWVSVYFLWIEFLFSKCFENIKYSSKIMGNQIPLLEISWTLCFLP